MQGLGSAVILLAAVLSASAVNPLTRFGKCKNYAPLADVDINDNVGVWYLQQRPYNKDNLHTCQAQFEKQVVYFTSLLYYYNKGETVNRPIQAEYAKVSDGIYRGAITVDGEAVNIFLRFIYFNKKEGVRAIYMCTDHEDANSDFDAILVSTRHQFPSSKVLNKGIRAANSAYCAVNGKDINLEQVVQDYCEPLSVSEGLDNPLLLS